MMRNFVVVYARELVEMLKCGHTSGAGLNAS
jgi:hypothetical protein